MKWGDKFPSEYVNRLYAMVNRNLSIPFRFVCFTENDSGIRNESFALQPTKALLKNSQLVPASLRCISQVDW
jgi:hypothetical protein